MSASAVQTSIKTALGALPSKFSKARSSGALYFFDSEVKDVEQDGNRFQIRVCPALQNKAKAKREADAKVGNTEQDQAEPKKSSPFEPPYVEYLFVGDLQGSQGEEGMAMLLNKYAVLPEHLLLCTKTQQPQSSPPTPHQLLLAYLTIHAASKHSTNRKRLLAFYNGGEGAGASQTWRHLQCIEVPRNEGAPIEEWVDDLEVERKDKPFVNTRLPHLHLMHHLPPAKNLSSTWTDESLDKMEMSLASAMVSLLDAMYDALRRNDAGRDGGWNLLMTLDHLHLIPRSKPNFQLPGGSKLEVNSLAFAGMLLVKSDEELGLLNKTTETNENGGTQGLMRVLEHCGVPRAWGEWEEAVEGTLAEPVQQQL